MRIISGDLKGKSIKFIKSKITRPLKDSVKENIFNILTHSKEIKLQIENTNVLDLYSGIGSFGLECISRGAKRVTFVEKDKIAFKKLKENLIGLSILEKAKIINKNIKDALYKLNKEKYNILFLDPPFKDKEYTKDLKILKKNSNLYKNHIIIIHREKRTSENLDDTLNIKTIRQYGRSKIIFGKFR